MLTYAGQPVTHEQIKGTIAILAYYRRFLASDCGRCRDVEAGWMGGEMTRDQARRRSKFLIDTAINRKAGIPDRAGRKQSSEYQVSMYRDCIRVRDNRNRRVVVRQFETREIEKRYGHILYHDED